MRKLILFLIAVLAVPSLFAAPKSFSVAVSGHGRPVILIPGLSSPGSVWDGTVAHLGDHYATHVLTLAGFAGEKPIDGALTTTVVEELNDYIRAQHLQRPIIIGHSLGAFIAFELASRHPDVTGPIVAVDGLPYAAALMMNGATKEQIAGQAAAMKAFFATQSPEQFAMQTKMSLQSMITRPEDVERVASAAVKSDPATVGRAMEELLTTDLRDDVAKITQPVLLIAAGSSEKSAEIKASYEAQIAKVKNHRVVVAEKARHFVMLDDAPFFFGAVDDFLKSSSTGNNERSTR